MPKMNAPAKHEWIAIAGGVGLLGVIGYVLLKKPATAQTSTAMGPTTVASYNPSSVFQVLGIGGSLAPNGTVVGNNIANSLPTDTPIGVDPLTGNVINAVETAQNNGNDVVVSPSSWQGTTGPSGAPTYLYGQNAGEGSGTLQLQGVTY